MKKHPARILIIDDDRDVLQAAQLLLKSAYGYVGGITSPEGSLELIKEEGFDLVLLDMNFSRGRDSGEEGLTWLKRIKEVDPSIIVILITAFGNMQLAIKAIKEGATDFVLKPWVNEKLLATVSSALQLRYAQQEVNELRSERQQMRQDMNRATGSVIGRSEPMRQVFDLIDKVAATDANVLLLGENGTGKEVIARLLHSKSDRAGEAFIGVDMGAIPETLFESELFGHVKGAFTDARENRPGRFEMASGGTLFLDEIGNLSMPMQAKLLNALQARKVVRVGSNKEVPINIRLICATNQPLHKMVAEGNFRQDLHYRINTIEIHLPPLRERKADIPLLAEYYLELYARKYNKWPMHIANRTFRRLEDYHWPGNVRELQHMIERAVILSRDDTLQPEEFFFPSSSPLSGNDDLVIKDYNLDRVEKMIILKALETEQGNITRAARQLGLTRAALYRRMEKYGI